jgi:hypothetical protein
MRRVYGFVVTCLAAGVVYGATSQDPRPNEAASRVRAAERRQYPAALIRDECIEFTELRRGSDFRECKVSESGQFGEAGGQTYYYASIASSRATQQATGDVMMTPSPRFTTNQGHWRYSREIVRQKIFDCCSNAQRRKSERYYIRSPRSFEAQQERFSIFQ